ncbi:MAG: hypothetical protein ACO3AV_10315, partial [Ilumatobacteraceae bacterium]
MESALAGQSALVTGGGSGIGLAFARRLGSDGAAAVSGATPKRRNHGGSSSRVRAVDDARPPITTHQTCCLTASVDHTMAATHSRLKPLSQRGACCLRPLPGSR